MQGPETRESLLQQLRDTSQQDVWSEFVQVYQPLVYRIAVSRGLQHSDALDVVQDVFCAVAGAIQRFDRDGKRGSFRGWLFTITRNRVINRLTRDERHRGAGDSRVQSLLNATVDESDHGDQSEFDLQCRRAIFRWAARRIRSRVNESTWLAFWQTTVEGQPIHAVAKQLNKSRGSVRIARCRVMTMLKEQVEAFNRTIESEVVVNEPEQERQ